MNSLHFVDSNKTCRTLFYMNSKTLIKILVYKGFVRFYTNTTAFKKHEKIIIIIVELKRLATVT